MTYLQLFLNIADIFWQRHPALLYSIAMALGIAASSEPLPIFLAPALVLFFPLALYHRCRTLALRLALAAAIAFASGLYFKSAYILPQEGKERISIVGRFSIESISQDDQYYGKQWNYRGKLVRCTDASDGTLVGKNIPCGLRLPARKEGRPPANCDYIISGDLLRSESGGYHLNIQKGKAWEPIPWSFSLAELRHAAKERVKKFLKKKVPDRLSAQFLCGIATGEFSDKQMQFELSRFGLQHIMAISGFHFAIVAGMLSMLLRMTMARRRASMLLIFLLCSYFVFLGPSASVMRAWLMVLIGVCSFLLEKPSASLNALGVAVMIILFTEPLMLYRLGFQFSVVVTASILINYSFIDRTLQRILPCRPLSEVVEMNLADQHGYCILAYFRKALSLALAVNLAAIPLTLYYFHKFPILGFAYNLFFPFMVSLSMLLLLLALLTFWIPLLPNFLHALNSGWTALTLSSAYNMPTSFDYFIRSDSISHTGLVLYLTLFFALSLFGWVTAESLHEEQGNFAFI